MNVAFIGMGTMGAPMALNVLRAGHEVVVYNRTREKELPLADAGALRADTPREAAKGAGIIITCVSDTPDVEAVILGDDGIIHGAPAGSLVIDMSTISPAATRHIAAKLAVRKIRMLDAPVSGGSEGAQNGTLAIMVGGEAKDVHQAMPVLEAMGKTITHVGTYRIRADHQGHQPGDYRGDIYGRGRRDGFGNEGRARHAEGHRGHLRWCGWILGVVKPGYEYGRQYLPAGVSGQTAPQGSAYRP